MRKQLAVLLALTALATGPSTAQEPLYDLLVSDTNGGTVYGFDGTTFGLLGPEFILQRGSVPFDLVTAHAGELLVLTDSTIRRFDPVSNLLADFSADRPFLRDPRAMDWGPDGNLYVSAFGRVGVFGPDGSYLRDATPTIGGDPWGFTWDEAGNLVVAFAGSADVRRFDADGNPLDILVDDPEAVEPVDVRYADNGNLQVLDLIAGTIREYTPDGTFSRVFADDLGNPWRMVMGPDDLLYVPTWGHNGALVQLDPVTGDRVALVAREVEMPTSVLFIERPKVFRMVVEPVLTFQIGEGGSIPVDLYGVRGVNYDLPVDLECEPEDPVVECEVAPARVTPGTQGATATLSVTYVPPQSAGLPVPLALTALVLLAAGALVRRPRVTVLLLGAVLIVACSGETTLLDPDPVSTTVWVEAQSDDVVLRAEVLVNGI